MKFGEKLRQARTNAHMTQAELAHALGLAKRTVEGYEACAFYPRKRETYDKLAAMFGMERNWFLTEGEDSQEDPARSEMEQVIKSVTALYNGGRLSEEDKDALARALMDAYWTAKGKRNE